MRSFSFLFSEGSPSATTLVTMRNLLADVKKTLLGN